MRIGKAAVRRLAYLKNDQIGRIGMTRFPEWLLQERRGDRARVDSETFS